tara:strand:- start:453 stop:626 length:174 start_codon:yes stop_codon:yes gene_type:complete
MKYYQVNNQIQLKIVDDSDAHLVPSHWKEVEGVGRECDKPNVVFDKTKKQEKQAKKK